MAKFGHLLNIQDTEIIIIHSMKDIANPYNSTTKERVLEVGAHTYVSDWVSLR